MFWRLGMSTSVPGFAASKSWRCTHEVGELLPFEFERSTAVNSAELGEPLLRTRLGAGSTRSALGRADEWAALVKEANWRGETWRSTAEDREVVGGAATAVDMLSWSSRGEVGEAWTGMQSLAAAHPALWISDYL